MAWDDFEMHGHKGFTGDKPMDEFIGALQRITAAYVERFSRKPTLAELVYQFEKALRSQSILGHAFGSILKSVPTAASQPIDFSCYEGAYSDSTEPGFHLIERRKTTGSKAMDVVKISRLEVVGQKLQCHYEIQVSDIDDVQAQALIARVLLKDYCDDYYRDKVGMIEFVNTNSGITANTEMERG